MKKLTVVILSLLLLVGCAQHNKELEKSFSSIVEEKSKNEIDVKSITNFDWEKAYLFTPYTPQESINEQLGVDFHDRSSIDYRDDIYLLVFLHDDKVVQYAEMDRQQTADFSIGEKEYLTPSNASICIERN
ncbi:hypothetical protein [Bacillus massiliglaciei]|uniref:hypothetical protein n=1 Tax=Bacillus massiliglaciei TaxID=1816693 RepID=UPI000A5F5469|nr:hypothetical protein [Bacillus massiliglaciei]